MLKNFDIFFGSQAEIREIRTERYADVSVHTRS